MIPINNIGNVSLFFSSFFLLPKRTCSNRLIIALWVESVINSLCCSCTCPASNITEVIQIGSTNVLNNVPSRPAWHHNAILSLQHMDDVLLSISASLLELFVRRHPIHWWSRVSFWRLMGLAPVQLRLIEDLVDTALELEVVVKVDVVDVVNVAADEEDNDVVWSW